MITVLNSEIATLQGQVEAHFGRHPDVEIHRSQPGLGQILGARVLGEFGDDPHRYRDDRLADALDRRHGCLTTGTLYDEDIAWAHHTQQDQQAAA